MRPKIEGTRAGRPIAANLIASWVLAAMLLVMTTFFAQFPEVPAAERAAATAR